MKERKKEEKNTKEKQKRDIVMRTWEDEVYGTAYWRPR